VFSDLELLTILYCYEFVPELQVYVSVKYATRARVYAAGEHLPWKG
jgi:hypothetical protein